MLNNLLDNGVDNGDDNGVDNGDDNGVVPELDSETYCCPICHDDNFTNNENDSSGCYTTSFGHLFHSSCINRWYLTSNTCPCCRTEVFVRQDTSVIDNDNTNNDNFDNNNNNYYNIDIILQSINQESNYLHNEINLNRFTNTNELVNSNIIDNRIIDRAMNEYNNAILLQN